MRIFAPTKSGMFYWVIHVLIWANLGIYITSTFLIIFQCVPQKDIWNPSYHGKNCNPLGSALMTPGAFNVISDILVLLLPIWATLHLHMTTKNMLGIVAVFATGLMYNYLPFLQHQFCSVPFTLHSTSDELLSCRTNSMSFRACISSICRLAYTGQLVHDKDNKYYSVQVMLWR